MIQIEKIDLMKFFQESFTGDLLERELRLSKNEVRILKKEFPEIHIDFMDHSDETNKQWYKITLSKR